MPKQLPEEVLSLIIRFTASLPDLTISIITPRTTSTLALKLLIRTHLPQNYGSNRLRLIFSGRILEDAVSLYQSLGLRSPSPAPPSPSSAKAKGKQPVRDDGDWIPPVTRWQKYIHCSLGDLLSSIDLEEEVKAAEAAEQALLEDLGPVATAETSTRHDEATLGFDRLLQTGFTAEDIATLRASFLNHLSLTHTPDTMPHGDTLRRLEDRWLDSDVQNAGADAEAIDDDESNALDDMFWGNIFGFFWPFGAIVWGFREEGVWTRRRKIAVFTGLMVNVVFGFARMTSSK